MKKYLKLLTAAMGVCLLIIGLTYIGCKKAELEKQENGNGVALTEFDEEGDRDHSYTVQPPSVDCSQLLATIPEQSSVEMFENLDILARLMTVMSNDLNVKNAVEAQVALLFDDDYNVLFTDLAIACANPAPGLPSKCHEVAERFFPSDLPVVLPRALEFRYQWEGDILYPQIFIPFFDQVDLSKSPIIAPFRSEADYEIGAEFIGYQLIFDDGDQQGTINVVNSALPSGKKKNELLDRSPLSDAVLLGVLGSSLPEGHIRQILEANAPHSQAIINAVNTSLLPTGTKSQILNAQPVVKLTEIRVTEEKAMECPIWVISVNESVNCQGTFNPEIARDLPTAAGNCVQESEFRWFEFFPKIKFECKNEHWASGKGDMYYSFVRYNLFDPCPACDGEIRQKLTRADGKNKIGNNDLCEDLDIHLEFVSSVWKAQEEIAILIYERDPLVTAKYWDYVNGDILASKNADCAIKYRAKQEVYFHKDAPGYDWSAFPTTGQWGGTSTGILNMHCRVGFREEDCDGDGEADSDSQVTFRGGRIGA